MTDAPPRRKLPRAARPLLHAQYRILALALLALITIVAARMPRDEIENPLDSGGQPPADVQQVRADLGHG